MKRNEFQIITVNRHTFAISNVASKQNLEPDVDELSVNKGDAFPKQNMVGGDQNSTRLDNIIYIIIIISWRYSPGWALASATICLQVSRSLALSLHAFILIFLRSMDTSSSHLIPGLPLRLVAYSFPYSVFFGIAVSCILSICPSHLILWHLINLTIFSPPIYNLHFLG